MGVSTLVWQAGEMLALALVVAAAPQSVEVFRDQSQYFVRAGSTSGLKVGSQLPILGNYIATTTERRTLGRATVLELWPTLARVSLDVPLTAIPEVPDGQALLLVELATTSETDEQRYGSVWVDPLGFATFGPTLGVELGGGHFAAGALVRWYNGGLVPNLSLVEGQRWEFSFALGGRATFYFREGFKGVHLGLSVEWLRRVLVDEVVLMRVTFNHLLPQFEGGYRWGNSRFFLGLAGSAGFTALLYWKSDNLPGGGFAASYVPPTFGFLATAKLELGVYF